jgi:serine/threonine protein kinase
MPLQTADDLKEGDVLAGKYRVERVIGVGGMGVVAAALHLELGTVVAIKLLLSAATATDEAIERFSREARAASRLRGEHAVRVFDVGKHSDGTPYMVMEYLVGEDLDTMVSAEGRARAEHGGRIRSASVRGGRRGPLDRHHSSGSEAHEPFSHATNRRLSAREGARLWNRQTGGSGER